MVSSKYNSQKVIHTKLVFRYIITEMKIMDIYSSVHMAELIERYEHALEIRQV